MVLWDCNFPFDFDVMNRLGKVLMPLSGYLLNRHTTSLGHLMLPRREYVRGSFINNISSCL